MFILYISIAIMILIVLLAFNFALQKGDTENIPGIIIGSLFWFPILAIAFLLCAIDFCLIGMKGLKDYVKMRKM